MIKKLSKFVVLAATCAVTAVGAAHADGISAKVKIGDLKIKIGPERDKVRRKEVSAPAFRCVSVARRKGGTGKRVEDIRGVANGSDRRNVCRQAVKRCNNQLDRRKASGKNRAAECVVARRVARN